MSSLIMMVAPTPARRDHLAGAHIVATLVPRHWEHLWAGTLDVSQPLLDADMERHHVACLGRVKCAPPQAAAAAHVPFAGYAHSFQSLQAISVEKCHL